MKTFLVLASIVTLSLASIGEVTNDIEEDAIRLWQKYCEGKSPTDEPSTEDNTYIYCKPAPASTTEVPVYHDTTFATPTKSEQDKIVIFIRPQAIDYNHNVTVRGPGAPLPQTVIYVKPVTHNHSIIVEKKATKTGTVRPIVYYLKKGHGGDDVRNSPPPTPVQTPAPWNNRPLAREPNTPFSPPNNPYFATQSGQSFDLPVQDSAAAFMAQQNVRAPQYANYNGNGYNNFQRRYNN